MRCFPAAMLVVAALHAASAQEISGAMGRLHAIGERDSTYSWQLQYLHHFSPTWSASLAWLNEGHLPDHHRDGSLLQVWRFHRMAQNDLRLGVGLGLYRSFDTTDEGSAEGYCNQHGLKPILSLRAQYPGLGGGWEAFVQLNRTLGGTDPQTQAILIGASTRFTPSARPRPLPHRKEGAQASFASPNELTLFFGRTILNSFESETSDALEAFSVEYRRRLTRYADATLTYCDEGGIDAVKRDGMAAQIWVSKRSPRGWLLGFGIGPYFSRVFPEQDSGTPHPTVTLYTSMRYSMVLGRHLWSHWGGRLQWNRTLTSYHRDTDVLQIGLAYQW